MRILFHAMYYAPEVGGLESHVAGLAEAMVRRGHDVRVVTSRSMPGLLPEERREGVVIRRSWLPARSAAGWFSFALASIPATREWASWADVLHAQSFASALPVGTAARSRDRPWVTSLHTSHFLRLAGRRHWRQVLKRLIRGPDRVLSASQEIANVAMALAPGVHVEALTNGVDTGQFRPMESIARPGSGERCVIVPRRLFEKNGVEVLVRALPAVRSRIPALRVLIVGDGPERQRLEGLAVELGVAESVQFTGARPHTEMPGLFASAEIAVFPSLMEATSVAALEAMSCGLPVVATVVGGLPEIVDSDVGVLVEAGDSGALAEGIVQLLEDPDRAARGERARDRVVRRWSNDRLVDRHLQIYEELLAERSTRGASPVGRS